MASTEMLFAFQVLGSPASPHHRSFPSAVHLLLPVYDSIPVLVVVFYFLMCVRDLLEDHVWQPVAYST